MKRVRGSVAWVFVAATLLGGCMGSGAARSRAANEFGCPDSEVAVTSVGANGWDATGCGQEAVFVCTTRSEPRDARLDDPTTCIREGDIAATTPPRPSVPGAAPAPGSISGGPERDLARRSVVEADLMCRGLSGPHGAGRATIAFSSDGHVDTVVLDERFDASATGECLRDRLRRATVPAFRGAPVTVHVHFFLPPAA